MTGFCFEATKQSSLPAFGSMLFNSRTKVTPVLSRWDSVYATASGAPASTKTSSYSIPTLIAIIFPLISIINDLLPARKWSHSSQSAIDEEQRGDKNSFFESGQLFSPSLCIESQLACAMPWQMVHDFMSYSRLVSSISICLSGPKLGRRQA